MTAATPLLTECDLFSIRKGEAVMVPIVVLNRLPEIWGADSHIFKYVNYLVEFCGLSNILAARTAG